MHRLTDATLGYARTYASCAATSRGTAANPCDTRSCRHFIPNGIGYTCSLAFVDAHPEGATCEQVAAVFGCSGEAVRQVEERALRKMRDEDGEAEDDSDNEAAA